MCTVTSVPVCISLRLLIYVYRHLRAYANNHYGWGGPAIQQAAPPSSTPPSLSLSLSSLARSFCEPIPARRSCISIFLSFLGLKTRVRDFGRNRVSQTGAQLLTRVTARRDDIERL